MIKENERTKEEQKERPCRRIRLQLTKCTLWPSNEKNYRMFVIKPLREPLIEEKLLLFLIS